MKLESQEKKESTPQKVWKASWRYIAGRSAKTIRTPQEQMHVQCLLDEVIVKHLGTDDPSFVDAELSRLLRKANGK